ncbi:MAG: hypothetical protein KQI62_00250 [Deltaproteobacteria bacterium]|nr:hypothetical protein [Deltaproteobacteria bacterium]
MSTSPAISLAEINSALAEFHAGLDEPYKMTPAGMWACSKSEEVYDLLEQVDLGGCSHFADLGSGDGRAVLIASLFMRATGIEVDPGLVQASRAMAESLGLNRAEFVCADCRKVDLTPFDLLFLYPDKPLNWLEEILPDGWKGRLLVYGPYFQPTEFTHINTIYAGKTMCTLWRC